MALDVNGYNNILRNFVEFARRRNAKAVTRCPLIDLPAENPTVTGCKTVQPPA